MPSETAKQAIARAIESRDDILGKRLSTRVEEIRPKEEGWTIVLSWLEPDEQAELAAEEEHPALRSLNHTFFRPIKGKRTERVYRQFDVSSHEDEHITMSTVEWAR